MSRNGDNHGENDVEELLLDVVDENLPMEGDEDEGIDPTGFDDLGATEPGKVVPKILAFGSTKEVPKRADWKPGELSEISRAAKDPDDLSGESEKWDTFGGRQHAKLEGSQTMRGETPLQESHVATLVRALATARTNKVGENVISSLIKEIRRHDPDFESPTAKAPVSFWRSRTAQTIAALGLIGAVGVGAYKIWEQFQMNPDEIATSTEAAAPAATPTASSEAPTPAPTPVMTVAPAAPTLYDQIGTALEVKTAGKNLDEKVQARIHAASSNDLTESLYEGAKRWENLDGSWLDTPAAHEEAVKKLKGWTGYADPLTVSASAHTIDEMLEQIANSDLPHAELVAWNVATQIASIQDPDVVPSVQKVQDSFKTVTPATIDTVLEEHIQNPPPPPGPSFFADQADQMGSLDSSLFDAPEPVSLLAKAVEMDASVNMPDLTADLEEEVATPAPRFEDRFDVIEPAFVKPLAEAKPLVPVFMDPTEAAEPVSILAARAAEIPDVTEFLEPEEEKTPPLPAPAPKPSLLDNAKSAFSGLSSRFKRWLS